MASYLGRNVNLALLIVIIGVVVAIILALLGIVFLITAALTTPGTAATVLVPLALLPAASTAWGKSMMTGPSLPTSTLYSERSPWTTPAHSMRTTCVISVRW